MPHRVLVVLVTVLGSSAAGAGTKAGPLDARTTPNLHVLALEVRTLPRFGSRDAGAAKQGAARRAHASVALFETATRQFARSADPARRGSYNLVGRSYHAAGFALGTEGFALGGSLVDTKNNAATTIEGYLTGVRTALIGSRKPTEKQAAYLRGYERGLNDLRARPGYTPVTQEAGATARVVRALKGRAKQRFKRLSDAAAAEAAGYSDALSSLSPLGRASALR